MYDNSNDRNWLMYNELAWIEPLICPPEDAARETELYCEAIKKYAKIKPAELLHLGCGAGINDFTFKKHFKVTGVDISDGMLDVAKRINSGIEYIKADMRSVSLGKKFDAVAVPDSIGYITDTDDLKGTIDVCRGHLKKGGVLLILTLAAEDFRENDFLYKGADGDLKVTVFENNDTGECPEMYEAAVVYLVRREGRLDFYTEKHVLGLFGIDTWLGILETAGFEVYLEKIDGLYESFLSREGKYIITMFACVKS